jgi:phospholipid-binding lipoprotein MlaA
MLNWADPQTLSPAEPKMSPPPSHNAPLLILFAALALGGCTTLPSQATPDPRDPLERLNRSTYAFNDGLDRAIVKPLARGYRKATPQFLQTGVSNFFSNAEYPVTLANNLLQGKITAAASDTARFVLNTTFGLGGLFDPATAWGLDRNDEDFGQTLGSWGVPPGPYLVVPFLGPYTLRDGIGSFADDFVEPRAYLEDDSTRWTLWAADKFDRRVRLLDADALLDRTGDPYAFVRSAYLQRREYLVRDGDVPLEDDAMLEDLEDLEDPVDPEDPPGDAGSPEISAR